MCKTCVQFVEKLRIACANLSTMICRAQTRTTAPVERYAVIHDEPIFCSHHYPQLQTAQSPQLITLFYPVSTAPIINDKKIKERI